jgi:MFS family permease
MGNNVSRKNVIFVGLMLGMLVAAVSQTVVSPAMPVIVSELGGIEHYSWIATSALLVSAVTVPVIGKLSDVYGRRGFYIAGLVVFMLGSIFAGAAQGFWWLVAARAVQGFGMGTIMPLSQTIISARERGRYMGYIGRSSGSPRSRGRWSGVGSPTTSPGVGSSTSTYPSAPLRLRSSSPISMSRTSGEDTSWITSGSSPCRSPSWPFCSRPLGAAPPTHGTPGRSSHSTPQGRWSWSGSWLTSITQ